MAEGHKNHHEYARDVAPRLNQHIEQLRDRHYEDFLGEAVMLFSFTLENIEAKAQRHQEILQKIGVILVAMNDILRGLHAGQANLSPMTVAALTRIALELRADILFIISRKDPELYADRYSRFRDVETLLHDSRKEPKDRMLTPAKREEILKQCPEWIKRKKNGELKIATSWTADDEFDNVAKIAKAAGIYNQYEVMYDVTSKFIHGSPLMAYGYRTEQGLNPLGDPKQCKQISSLGCMFVMNALRKMCEFFQVPLNRDAYAAWSSKFISTCSDVLPNGLDAALGTAVAVKARTPGRGR